MKPIQEQTWSQGVNRWRIYDVSGDGARIERVRTFTDAQTPGDADAVAQFISAGPDMARALLAVLDEHAAAMPHTAVVIEDALRKAGVL